MYTSIQTLVSNVKVLGFLWPIIHPNFTHFLDLNKKDILSMTFSRQQLCFLQKNIFGKANYKYINVFRRSQHWDLTRVISGYVTKLWLLLMWLHYPLTYYRWQQLMTAGVIYSNSVTPISHPQLAQCTRIGTHSLEPESLTRPHPA